MPQSRTAVTGTLFIVATPIGNLEDITQRALRILREVDIIACEDTRRTQGLLNHFGIKVKTISYHEHNERERAEQLCEMLEAGKNVAVVSDAGTPVISDPGFRIVNVAIQRSIPIVSIPGPTAFVTALAASGLPSDEFFFAGFLPPRANARRSKLEKLREIPATLIFYEAPHRIAKTLHDAFDILGDRRASVARELTKMHEEIVRGGLDELRRHFSQEATARGEMVLLIAGFSESESGTTRSAGETEISPERLIARVRELEGKGFDSKSALKKAARESGLKRSEAYRLMVAQKKRRSK